MNQILASKFDVLFKTVCSQLDDSTLYKILSDSIHEISKLVLFSNNTERQHCTMLLMHDVNNEVVSALRMLIDE